MSRVPLTGCESSTHPFPLTSLNFQLFRTAIESLIQYGYQPSHTLVFSLLFDEVRHCFLSRQTRRRIHTKYTCQDGDAQEVNHYLHSTYDEQELEMGLTMPQIPQCKGLCALRRLFDELYWTVSFYLPDILYWPAIDPVSLETYQSYDGEGEHQQTGGSD